MTPHSVDYGLANELITTRQQALDVAFAAYPSRFKGRRPAPAKLPTAAWINPAPKKTMKPISQPQHYTLLSKYMLNGDAKSLIRSGRIRYANVL